MNSGETPVLVASGLGWPEGPTVRPDGSVVFVESYRSQLTVAEVGGETRRNSLTPPARRTPASSAATARSMSVRTAAPSGRGALRR